MSAGAPRQVCVIANPAAGRGRGARVLARARPVLEGLGISDIRVTERAGDEPRIVAQALAAGCDTIVAVGGDGTWSNVANAILRQQAGSRVRFAMLASGTGNDFAKTIGAPVHDVRATARLALTGGDTLTDVGRIGEQYFLNIAGFGVDASVLERLSQVRWLRGDALYVYAGLRELFRYGGMDVEIESVHSARRGRHLLVIIANARNFGGVFRLAPDASTVDGQLDGVAIVDTSPLRRLQLFFAAARGVHARQREVTIERSPRFTLRFRKPPAFELDGELNQSATAELMVECVPRALRVVGAANGTAANSAAGGTGG